MANSENPTHYLKGTAMKTKLNSVKKFAAKHRVAIAVGATILVMGRLQFHTAAQFNEFLKEHGLFDEYYAMNEED